MNVRTYPSLLLGLHVQCNFGTMVTMKLIDHELKQINQEYLASLSPGHLLHRSAELTAKPEQQVAG